MGGHVSIPEAVLRTGPTGTGFEVGEFESLEFRVLEERV
jgi:hypothetical protein